MAKTKLARGQQTEWIKEALAAGITGPKEIAAHIKHKHGHDVSTNYISNMKNNLKSKGVLPAASVDQPVPKKLGRPKGVPNKPKASANGDVLSAVQAVREAADKVGGMDKLIEVAQAMR